MTPCAHRRQPSAVWIRSFIFSGFPTARSCAAESIKTAAGLTYTQVTAADVTELMWRQKHLQEESAKLAEANERMRRLFEQMPEIIRQEETLAMKLRVHDDIGHSILAVRRALIRRAGLEELRASAALWEQSIAVLYRSNRITASPEPMKVAVRRAAEMGVRVLTEESRRNRGVSAKRSRWQFGNARPTAPVMPAARATMCAFNRCAATPTFSYQQRQRTEGEITEGGGLSMLRHHVEETGGRMEIQSLPRFSLMLSLPEKEGNPAHEW